MENSEEFKKQLKELSVNCANRKYMSLLNGFLVQSNELLIANFLISTFNNVDIIDEVRQKQLLTLYTILSL